MAVTQYIGARYVPLIYQNPDDNSNNWKAGVEYEPLTMVSYGGGAYTSKTQVPATAPNPAEGTNYWVYMGTNSGQVTINTNSITQIRYALAAATEAGYICTSEREEGDYVWIAGALYKTTAHVNINDNYVEGINITPVSDAISTLINELGNVNSDIDDITDALDTMADQIDTLKGYNNFNARKIICISDSYGLTPSIDNSWIAKLKQYLNIPTGNFWRTQANGAGFVGVTTTTFESMATEVISTLDADTKNAITDVIIGGGFNDADALRRGTTDTGAIASAINSCLAYIRTSLPNARIYVFMPTWTLNSDFHSYIRSVYNLYMQGLRFTTRAAFIDGIDWLHRQALLDSTEYHPNTNGAYAIALSLASVLLGGSTGCDLAPSALIGYITPAFSANTANISGFDPRGAQMLCKNGWAWFRWVYFKFNILNTLNNMGFLELATFTDGIMSGGPSSSEGYMMNVNTNIGPCMLLVYNNKLYLWNGTGAAIPANTAVNVYFGSMCGPIDL